MVPFPIIRLGEGGTLKIKIKEASSIDKIIKISHAIRKIHKSPTFFRGLERGVEITSQHVMRILILKDVLRNFLPHQTPSYFGIGGIYIEHVPTKITILKSNYEEVLRANINLSLELAGVPKGSNSARRPQRLNLQKSNPQPNFSSSGCKSLVGHFNFL